MTPLELTDKASRVPVENPFCTRELLFDCAANPVNFRLVAPAESTRSQFKDWVAAGGLALE